MAMVKCKECGKEISDTAKACPHCGAKRISKNINLAYGCLAVIFVFIIVVVYIFNR